MMKKHGVPMSDMHAYAKSIMNMEKPASQDPFVFDGKPIHPPIVEAIARAEYPHQEAGRRGQTGRQVFMTERNKEWSGRPTARTIRVQCRAPGYLNFPHRTAAL